MRAMPHDLFAESRGELTHAHAGLVRLRREKKNGPLVHFQDRRGAAFESLVVDFPQALLTLAARRLCPDIATEGQVKNNSINSPLNLA